MIDVFVSYSRRNLTFVQRLTADLGHLDKDVWFDQKKEPLVGLAPTVKWWDEIKHGIETADNFLIVISPESMASPYCHAEIAHAIRNDKRIVPLIYCQNGSQVETFKQIDSAIDDIDSEAILPDSVSADIINFRSLARRNWRELTQYQFLPYINDPDWNQWLRGVVDAVDLDIQWIRMWTQFRQAVQIWVESNYDEYERWSDRRLKAIREVITKRNPNLTQDQKQFLIPEPDRLIAELEEMNTTHQRRLVIGQRLDELGDSRTGIGLRPDGLPSIEWCYVDVPQILRGQSIQFKDQLGEVYTEQTIEPFWISKYPLTYQQVKVFEEVISEGPWWEKLAANYDRLSDPHIKLDNNPRDNINWYQAMAIARWLDIVLPNDAYPLEALKGYQTRLLFEWEWQWAARGGIENRDYPWGTWNREFANTSESGLNRPIAVGMYPNGAAKSGAFDMSGQLYTWCLNEYESLEINLSARDTRRVLRGGSYHHSSDRARCTFRHYRYALYGEHENHGILLARANPVLPSSRQDSR